MATKIISSRLKALERTNDALEMVLQRGDKSQVFIVPLVWLRDHCKDPQSYNATTNQRNSDATDLFEKAEIDDIVKDSELDRPHPLADHIKPWKRLEKTELPRIHISDFNMKFAAESFVKYGMVMIDGVEANAQATEELCRRVAPIHDTFYGAFWVFSNQAQEKGEEYHEDTAYGSDTIGPHTDGTYFNQTPGIQVFHCLHAAEKGGDTVLVDGFQCATQLKDENPRAFKLLSKRMIEHHYIETGAKNGPLYSTSREKPVIELDSWGNIVQIRPARSGDAHGLSEQRTRILCREGVLKYKTLTLLNPSQDGTHTQLLNRNKVAFDYVLEVPYKAGSSD
nr:Taurine catabolism dioxygenase TauD TfdA domain containing protein [Haemonchus contortus]